MTLPAVDMALSSTSPLPEGAIAPTSADGAPEAAATPEVPATKSPASDVTPAKSPAASLISIAAKGKSSGPAKAGDLTRFFELTRRQAAPTPLGERPPAETTSTTPAELEIAQSPVAGVSSPIETSIGEAPVVASPMVETAAKPAPIETATAFEIAAVTPAAEPMTAPARTIEPSFPLMLAAPPVVTDGAAMVIHVEPDAAPSAESEVPAVPDWVKAVSTVEDTLPSETAERIKVALFPMEEMRPAEIPDPEHDRAETAPASALAAVIEPLSPAEVGTAAQAAAPIEPIAVVELSPPSKESVPALAPVAVASVTPAPAPIPAAPPTPVFKELVDYWRSLRRGDDNPAPESIDRDLVAERWPGSLIMTYTPASQDPRGELRPSRVTRLGTACAEAQGVAEVGSQSTEWMLEVARTALVSDEPVEEQQRLETLTGVAGFRMVALPLGPPKGLPSAVLCILTPNPGAPRFGKRRVWL